MHLTVDPKAQGLIFDIDGTLADTMPAHLRSWREVAEQYGFEFSETLFYNLAGMRSADIILYINRHQGLMLDPTEIVNAKNRAYLKLSQEIRIIEPVFHLVKEFTGIMPMALGTGECREIALINIKLTGLDRYFDKIVTADDITRSKPDPETFLKCARLLNLQPDVCQVFEDGEAGLEAASRGGMISTDVRPFLK